jgi:hypothetical protein
VEFFRQKPLGGFGEHHLDLKPFMAVQLEQFFNDQIHVLVDRDATGDTYQQVAFFVSRFLY